MLELIGKKVGLTYFSILNAILSFVMYCLLNWLFAGWPMYKILTIAFSIPPLTLLALSWGDRKLWAVIRKFDPSFYPDINGTWEGEIQLGNNGESLPLKAHVRVSLFDMSMDFQSSTADSITVSMALRTEKGQHFLDYIYRNDSKFPNRDPYNGVTTMRVEMADGFLCMRGHYFTFRKTNGTIRLRRIGN